MSGEIRLAILAAMIVAGIDEAGYGPLLGPLVVGCCAFDLGDAVDRTAPLPCLWKLLRKSVSKKRSKNGRKLHVNDSKLVYSPSAGLKELERSVLSLALCANDDWDGSLSQFFHHLAPKLIDDLPQYSWYGDSNSPVKFPIEHELVSLKILANGLRLEMKNSAVLCAHIRTRVVLERELNRMIEQTRNKSEVLFSISAGHIDELLNLFGERDLVIFCDRQGGREHYAHHLRLMFDAWSLEIIDEKPSRAEYRLTRGDHSVRILFCEKAETQCMAVAYASMMSKYLREMLMRRFNAFWITHLPNVEPTAGYYNDGVRFLRDIESARKRLGIEDSQLVRCR